MSKTHLANQTPDITAEACAWIAQLETGDLTPADMDAFREWMHRSPRHAAEGRRLARLSAELDAFSSMEPALREAAEHYRPITRKPASFSDLFMPLRVGSVAVIASVVMVAMVVLLRSPTPFPTELETSIGGYLEETLADGTVVKLNTNSRIDISYNDKQRQIFLHRGEVFFQVAHNPEKPFVVHVNGKTIRAVGTAFAVRLDRAQNLDADLQVTVTEGRVALQAQRALEAETAVAAALGDASTDRAGQSPGVVSGTGQAHNSSLPVQTMLEAGQKLLLTAQTAPEINQLSDDEIRRSLSWREGLFDFSNAPLEQVVKEFDRHTPLNIEIADSALWNKKFSGIFPTGNIDALLETLEAAYGIEVTYVDEGTVRLHHIPKG